MRLFAFYNNENGCFMVKVKKKGQKRDNKNCHQQNKKRKKQEYRTKIEIKHYKIEKVIQKTQRYNKTGERKDGRYYVIRTCQCNCGYNEL